MRLSETPFPALVCGLGGTIPFVFLSIGVYVFPYEWKLIALYNLLNYSVIVLSFLGAVHWGVAIYGKNKNHFIKQLKNKIDYQSFNNLKDALKKIIFDIKIEKKNEHKTILFSPSAASFDSFKNFEDRGKKFNILVQKLNLKKLINA